MVSERTGRFREWLNGPAGRWIVGGTVLALIGVAVTLSVTGSSNLDGKRDRVRAKGRRIFYYCTACKASGKLHVAFDQTYPVPCPQCKQPAAVPGFRCTRCGKMFEKVDRPICFVLQRILDDKAVHAEPIPAAPRS